MIHGTPSSKRTKALLKQLPAGCRIEKVGRKAHPAVFGPDGKQLRSPNGLPIYITGTGYAEEISHDLARIRKALRGRPA